MANVRKNALAAAWPVLALLALALGGCGIASASTAPEPATVPEAVLDDRREPALPGLSEEETEQPLYPSNPLDYDWKKGRLLEE